MSKKMIKEIVNEFIELEGSIEDVIKRLKEEEEYYLQRGYRNIQLEKEYLAYEEGSQLVLMGKREETDQEYKRRLQAEKIKKEKIEKREKEEFERLKKKFEK
jgi:hypothetical protein